MNVLEPLFATLKVSVSLFHNGQYCGHWAVDTSGSDYINFHIVTHGSCYLTMPGDNTEPVVLHQGDMVIFPNDSRHSLTSSASNDIAVNQSVSASYQDGISSAATGLLCGYFAHQHPIVKHITTQLPEVILLRHKADQENTLHTLLQVLISEATKTEFATSWILNKLAEAIMALLFKEHLSSSEGLLAGLSHPKIGKAVMAVQAAPATKWTLDSLAGTAFMSRSAFSATFKEVCGMTAMEFVTYWRLSLAYRWLADGEQTILGAALATGYDNELSFSKAFKRVIGIPPGAVRSE
ncbi:MAG: AraC family transcriptional regulator [Aestuariibacter sp.]